MNARGLQLPADLGLIAETLDLGQVTLPPVELKPGSVPVWRLTTDRADFHVKVCWTPNGTGSSHTSPAVPK